MQHLAYRQICDGVKHFMVIFLPVYFTYVAFFCFCVKQAFYVFFLPFCVFSYVSLSNTFLTSHVCFNTITLSIIVFLLKVFQSNFCLLCHHPCSLFIFLSSGTFSVCFFLDIFLLHIITAIIIFIIEHLLKNISPIRYPSLCHL